MVEHVQIERIARDVVNANTAFDSVVSVSSRDGLDWTGDPIVRISIVVKPEAADVLTGKAPLNILTGISDQLMAIGEDRFPILDYATTADLEADLEAADDDSEP